MYVEHIIREKFPDDFWEVYPPVPDQVVGSARGADPHNNKILYAGTHGVDKNTANSNNVQNRCPVLHTNASVYETMQIEEATRGRGTGRMHWAQG